MRLLFGNDSLDFLLAECFRNHILEPEIEQDRLLLQINGDAENLVALFRFRDAKRSLSLIARAAGEVFDNRNAAEKWLQSERPEIATAAGLGGAKAEVEKCL